LATFFLTVLSAVTVFMAWRKIGARVISGARCQVKTNFWRYMTLPSGKNRRKLSKDDGDRRRIG
jgi:hypothetical protein